MKMLLLAGQIASGKQTVVDLLRRHYRAHHVSISGLMEAKWLAERGDAELARAERADLQAFGDRCLERHGWGYIGEFAREHLGALPEVSALVVLEAVRRPEQFAALTARYPDAVTWYLEAPVDERVRRIRNRRRYPGDESMTLERLRQQESHPVEAQIPLLRDKVHRVIDTSGLLSGPNGTEARVLAAARADLSLR